MAAYSDDGQWRWRKQIIVRGRKVRGSGTPTVNTKRAAEAAEADWITKAAGGGPLRPGEVPTIAKVLESYLAHLAMHRSPSLKANRTSTYNAHLSPWFGQMRLDQIGPAEIDKYKAAKLEAKLAPGTVNSHILSVTNLLRWAVTRGHLADVPKVELLPRRQSSDVEHLEDADLAAVIAGASGDLRTMIIVAAYTGLRASELLSLQWKDLDLKGSRMVVRHNVYRGEDRPPKGKRERVIPLGATAAKALKAHQHLRSHLVFCHMDGAAIPGFGERSRERPPHAPLLLVPGPRRRGLPGHAARPAPARPAPRAVRQGKPGLRDLRPALSRPRRPASLLARLLGGGGRCLSGSSSLTSWTSAPASRASPSPARSSTAFACWRWTEPCHG